MNLRVGVIGAGGMGREHITNLTALGGVEVAVVADVVADAATAAAAIAGAEATTDALGVATNRELDGVVIASPDDTHAVLAIAAIDAGLPLLCEKPLAVTEDDARRVVDAETAAGQRLLQLGLMREYDAAHRQVFDALDGLGALHHLRLVHRNTNHAWNRSLTTIISQSIVHDIHSARWFSGQEFTSVAAQVVRSDARIEHVQLLGEMTGGISVSIEFVEAAYGYDVEVEATCEGGMVSAAQPPQPLVRRNGAAHRHIGDDWFGRFRDAYRLEVEDWVAGLRSAETFGPSSADGLAAQRVVGAAIAAAESGSRVHLDAP